MLSLLGLALAIVCLLFCLRCCERSTASVSVENPVGIVVD